MTLHAFRAEMLSVPEDPEASKLAAVRHFPDGLMVIEDGIVAAIGPYDDLAQRFADVPVETLTGLLVPGFIDAHVHYPQTERIASHGEQLLEWLERHIFPAEAAFYVASRLRGPDTSWSLAAPPMLNTSTASPTYDAVVDLPVPANAGDPSAVTSCFTSAYGRSPVRAGSYLREADGRIRRFSPPEILRLLGFREMFQLPVALSYARAWPLVGNSLSVPAVRHVLACIPELSAAIETAAAEA